MSRPGVEAARVALAALGLPAGATLEAVTSGHINESWRVALPDGDVLLQWLNHGVFPEADAVQDNAEVVLEHLAAAARQGIVPALLAAPDGARRVRLDSGLWRAFDWLPGRDVHERPADAGMARRAGAALGRVLHDLRALPAERVRPVLARFHDLDVRLADFDAACSAASAERRTEAAPLLARIDAERESRRAAAPSGEGARVLHGDPKFTNFLVPRDGQRPFALVDWDTVMVGPLAWDLGDFLRSAASRGREDDPAGAGVDVVFLEAGARGFLDGLAETLTATERRAFVAAPAHMAFMLAVRFLTDHLAGDRYFRVRRPRQNLARARTQLALVDGFDAARDALAAVVGAAPVQE